jgi:hypothetical protein
LEKFLSCNPALAFRISVWECVSLLLKLSYYAGISYAWDFLRFYKEDYQLRNFAGNLLFLKDEYVKSSGAEPQFISEQILSITKALVMKNGVRKMTLPGRHNEILERIVSDERFRLKKDVIKVLDIPSSLGIAQFLTDITGLSPMF